MFNIKKVVDVIVNKYKDIEYIGEEFIIKIPLE